MPTSSTSRKRPPSERARKEEELLSVDPNAHRSVRANPGDCGDNDANDMDSADAEGVRDRDDKKSRMQREIASLHQEMDITGYAKTAAGQRRRKLPRDESKRRTQKRRLLEQADARELALEAEVGDSNRRHVAGGRAGGTMKRLRGSQAAINDDVVQNSLIFDVGPSTEFIDEGDGDQKENVNHGKDGENFGNESEREPNLEHETQLDVGGYGNVTSKEWQPVAGERSNALEEEADELEVQEDADQEGIAQALRPRSTTRKTSQPSVKQRRRMYRLRNFQSFKMAERHGDALAAHARGNPRLAIEKLKAVAKAAPSAAQVYSSLGMVYEDMLKESRNRSSGKAENKQQAGPERSDHSATERENADLSSPTACTAHSSHEDAVPDNDLAEQLALSKKAYGSYHIAALLCKKDFTLWVRAADSASDSAGIHEEILKQPNLSIELRDFHRSEKLRWQSEALRDFLVADNLKPPGIDVPAKLAVAHMELGNLSEAFTILTDLKNRAGFAFRSSYKAWMLYSDLMLRLGHECIQWNRKIYTNENYMVRRWLRKFSKVFDWQERRLQALSLALEAAAGTKNTERFVSWIRKRAMDVAKNRNDSQKMRNEASCRPENLDSNEHSDYVQSPQDSMNLPASSDDGISAVAEENSCNILQFDEEKALLLDKQTKELEAFDKTTADMCLVSQSAPAIDRQAGRNLLLKSHESALCTIVTEYNQREIPSVHSEEQNEKTIGLVNEILPVSGSIRQVCLIASELLKHLLGLKLYKGARLAGESVSSYLKDRARQHEVTVESKKKAEQWQQRALVAPFMLGAYDDTDGDESDSEGSPYLSDEDTLFGRSEVLHSLRRGVLPPELKVLYGMALIGEGGRNFIALRSFEAIAHLDQESTLWLSDGEHESELAADPQWFLFRRAMTEPLGRTAAYAFCSDVLRQANKEKEWGPQLSPMFRGHLETMKRVGLKDELLRLRGEITPNVNFRKNQLLKVILAACKFDIDTLNESAEKSNTPSGLDNTTRIKIACAALTSMASIMPLVWTVQSDGGLPQICKEVSWTEATRGSQDYCHSMLFLTVGVSQIVTVSARCIRWLSGCALQELSYSILKSTLEQVIILVSFLCGDSIPFVGGASDETMRCLRESRPFPIGTSWQPNEFRTLSIRSYNLCVGCNVTLFSGWENEEFTLKLLRRRYGHRHFGVQIRDKRIAGCLPSRVEKLLRQQWDKLAELEPSFPVLNVAEKLSNVKQSDWYKEETRNREESIQIANYGEDEALEILLGFSAMCLHQAASETDQSISNRSYQLALSVLLPTVSNSHFGCWSGDIFSCLTCSYQ
jgi:hypothetical protein